MNKFYIVITVLVLSGCSLDPEFQTALNNYAKDNCKGKLLQVATRSLDGTIDSKMFYHCIEDSGVKTHWVTISEIPAKYWELE